jgi:hypothetical protein
LLPYIQVITTGDIFVDGASQNADNFDHIKLGPYPTINPTVPSGSLGFEDQFNGGDQDFNDMILKIPPPAL